MADAKYWNGSSWVSVPAIKHWDGDQWADVKRVLQWDGASWDEVWSGTSSPESPLYIYNEGTENYSIVKKNANSPYTYSEYSTYIYIRGNKVYYNNGGGVTAETENKIDVTDYNTAYFYYDSKRQSPATNQCTMRMYVGSEYEDDYDTAKGTTTSVDISSLTGSQYIGMKAYVANYADTDGDFVYFKIRKIWLEV